MKTTKTDLQGKLVYARKKIYLISRDLEAIAYACALIGVKRNEAEEKSLIEDCQEWRNDWKAEQYRMEDFLNSLDSLKGSLLIQKNKWISDAERYEQKLEDLK